MDYISTILAVSRAWLGTKYHHQGRLKKSENNKGGVDCFGLIIGIAKELNIKSITGDLLYKFDETNYSASLDNDRLEKFLDKHLIKVQNNNWQVGDILLFKIFKYPQHIAIFSKYQDKVTEIIHCHSSSEEVVEHTLSPVWQRMIAGIYRFKW